jgi:hypothetical protein
MLAMTGATIVAAVSVTCARLAVQGLVRPVSSDETESGGRPVGTRSAENMAGVHNNSIQLDRGTEMCCCVVALWKDVARIVPPLSHPACRK